MRYPERHRMVVFSIFAAIKNDLLCILCLYYTQPCRTLQQEKSAPGQQAVPEPMRGAKMLLETCKPLQQDGQLRAGRAAARGEAAVAHAGQEPGLQRPADGRFRVGGDLRAVGKGVQRR